MTRTELIAAVVVLALIALLLLYVVLIGLRKQQLLGRPGGIPLALRSGTENWTLGVGRFVGNELQWYNALRPGRRPTRVLRRSDLEITGQRGRRPAESMLAPGSVVVECYADGDWVSLALTPAAVTGFLAWLESSAPR